MTDTQKITIKLIEYGEKTVELDRARYETAKVTDELPDLIDAVACDMSAHEIGTTVVEPDGTQFPLYASDPMHTDPRGEAHKLAVLGNELETLAREYERAANDASAQQEFGDARNFADVARDLRRVLDGAR